MKALFLVFSLSLFAPCAVLAQIPWPVLPDKPCGHSVHGTIGEPRGVVGRGAHLHDGVDIGNPQGHRVYAVAPGPVTTGSRNGIFAGANADLWVRVGNYAYVHLQGPLSQDVLNAKNRPTQSIPAGTFLGLTNWRAHVHFKSGPPGASTNPLAQLSGYSNTQQPYVSPVSSNIGAVYLQDHRNGQPLSTEPDGTFILGSDLVDLVANAFDQQSCGSNQVGLYEVGYKVQQNSTGNTLASDVGIVFSALPTTDPTNVYLMGSVGAEPPAQNKFLYIANDTVTEQRPIDVSSYASGLYTFTFTGCDTQTNCTSTSVVAVLQPASIQIQSSGCTKVGTDFSGNNIFQLELSGTATGPVGSSLVASDIAGPGSVGSQTCLTWSGSFPQTGSPLNGCRRGSTDPQMTQWSVQATYTLPINLTIAGSMFIGANNQTLATADVSVACQ